MDKGTAFFRRMPVLGAFAMLPLLLPSGAQAGPRLFNTVEFQMELKKTSSWKETAIRLFSLTKSGLTPLRCGRI